MSVRLLKVATLMAASGALLGLSVAGAAALIESWFALAPVSALGAGVLVVGALSMCVSAAIK